MPLTPLLLQSLRADLRMLEGGLNEQSERFKEELKGVLFPALSFRCDHLRLLRSRTTAPKCTRRWRQRVEC